MNQLYSLPNLLTFSRIILIPFFVMFFYLPVPWGMTAATGVFIFAAFTDWLDGYLARRFDWRTRLGGLLDPAADKLLMFASFVTMTWMGWVPVGFTAIVIGRDSVIIAGTIVYHFLVEPVHGEPTRASKLNTVLQILFILLTIAHAWLGWPPMIVVEALGATILVTIAISIVQYVTTGFSRLRQAKQ